MLLAMQLHYWAKHGVSQPVFMLTEGKIEPVPSCMLAGPGPECGIPALVSCFKVCWWGVGGGWGVGNLL